MLYMKIIKYDDWTRNLIDKIAYNCVDEDIIG
jgi:hypothetical protein